MSKVRLAIVDFDTVVFRHALRAQGGVFDVNPEYDIEISDDEKEVAFQGIKDELKDILYRADCTKARLYLSGSGNFRYNILPSYKWRRVSAPRPIILKELKDRVIKELGAILEEGIEADDSCTMDFSLDEEGITKVLCHVDKDLDQVSGEHYNYDTDETYFLSKEEADKFLYFQVLAGDGADCYAGCPYVGGEIDKNSVKGKGLTKKERIEASKAMEIINSSLCVRPILHTYTKGKKAGTSELKWEEYHDKKLTLHQRIKTWYTKGLIQYGTIGKVKGFNTTSGFEDKVKVSKEHLVFINGVYQGLTAEGAKQIENEINTQYTIAYMLRAGDDIPLAPIKLNF